MYIKILHSYCTFKSMGYLSPDKILTEAWSIPHTTFSGTAYNTILCSFCTFKLMWYSSPYKILIGAWSIAHITLSHDIHLLGLFVARWYFSTTSSGPCNDRWRCCWHCFSAWGCNKHLRTRQWRTFPNWHWDWFDLQQMEHVKHSNTNKDQKIKSLKMSGQILISCELKRLTHCHLPNIPIS